MSFPPDLIIEGRTGGLHPWEESQRVRITADGQGTSTRRIPSKIGAPPLEASEFELEKPELEKIWRAIERNGFFMLEPEHVDEYISGGSAASLTITAHGRVHRVRVQNVALPPFEAIIQALNEATPPGKDLIYERSSQQE